MNSDVMYDELLDLVNENDQVIMQKYRSEVWKEKINNFRAINAFLMNDKNEVWIPRRAAHKQLFPLSLDSSVGGHVMAGESYDQAFKRELMEELNIELSEVSHCLMAKLTPSQHNVSSYMQIYLIKSNITPEYNRDDFTEYMWINILDLQAKIQNGEPTKSDLPTLLNSLKNWLEAQ